MIIISSVKLMNHSVMSAAGRRPAAMVSLPAADAVWRCCWGRRITNMAERCTKENLLTWLQAPRCCDRVAFSVCDCSWLSWCDISLKFGSAETNGDVKVFQVSEDVPILNTDVSECCDLSRHVMMETGRVWADWHKEARTERQTAGFIAPLKGHATMFSV